MELAETLQATTLAYRLQLSLDLLIIEELLRLGEATIAAEALEGELLALQGFHEGLDDAVATATDRRGA